MRHVHVSSLSSSSTVWYGLRRLQCPFVYHYSGILWEHYYLANAAIYFVRGLGAVMGAPIAGALLGAHPGEGQLLQPKAQLMAAGVCVVAVRWFDARAKGKWKWIA